MDRIEKFEVGIENECQALNREGKATTKQEEGETYTKSTTGSGAGTKRLENFPICN